MVLREHLHGQALVLDKPRDPAQVCVAAHVGLSTRMWSLTLHKGARDRAGEDAVASRLALHALAGACGGTLYPGAPGLPQRDTLELASDEMPQVTPMAHALGPCGLQDSPVPWSNEFPKACSGALN